MNGSVDRRSSSDTTSVLGLTSLPVFPQKFSRAKGHPQPSHTADLIPHFLRQTAAQPPLKATSSSSILSSLAHSSSLLPPLPQQQQQQQLPTTSPHPSGSIRPKAVHVQCKARTRVPTPHGPVFLHIYHNNIDNKDHLAIVIDPAQLAEPGLVSPEEQAFMIRSRSLDAKWHSGETDMERLIRGAYVGRLTPTQAIPSRPSPSPPPPPPPSSSSQSLSSPQPPAQRSEPCEISPPDIPSSSSSSPSNPASSSIPIPATPTPIVRIHSECYTGETIGSMRCDCGEQLDEAIRYISQPQPPHPLNPRKLIQGRGAIIYMRQEGRGIGLLEKIRAYNLQDMGHDTVSANIMLGHGADERGYDVAAAIMRDLGLDSQVRLLTNNPDKMEALRREGVTIKERLPMVPRTWTASTHSRMKGEPSPVQVPSPSSSSSGRVAGATMIGGGAVHGVDLEKYLRTKVLRMGHLLELPTPSNSQPTHYEIIIPSTPPSNSAIVEQVDTSPVLAPHLSPYQEQEQEQR